MSFPYSNARKYSVNPTPKNDRTLSRKALSVPKTAGAHESTMSVSTPLQVDLRGLHSPIHPNDSPVFQSLFPGIIPFPIPMRPTLQNHEFLLQVPALAHERQGREDDIRHERIDHFREGRRDSANRARLERAYKAPVSSTLCNNRKRSTYIRPSATSITLSRSANCTNPSQIDRTLRVTTCSASTRCARVSSLFWFCSDIGMWK